MSQPYPLDYLFIAECTNGTIVKQDQTDSSKLDRNGSAYTDVMHNLPLKSFSLVGRGHIFTVDYSDGSISIDGRKCYSPRPPDKNTVKPIYHRQVTHVAASDLTGIQQPKVRYFIGWQAQHRGKNYEFTLGVE